MLRSANRWLPVIVWMAFIFTMSSSLGAADNTSRFLGPLLRGLLPHASEATIVQLQFLIRKAGHFTEYAVLSLLLLRALLPAGFAGAPTWKALAMALLVATAYAATDEFHQSFVPGRTPAVGDVLIDVSGAACALAAMAVFRMKRRPQRP